VSDARASPSTGLSPFQSQRGQAVFDDLRSVSPNPGPFSHSSGPSPLSVSPNAGQNQPIISGRGADDLRPLQVTDDGAHACAPASSGLSGEASRGGILPCHLRSGRIKDPRPKGRGIAEVSQSPDRGEQDVGLANASNERRKRRGMRPAGIQRALYVPGKPLTTATAEGEPHAHSQRPTISQGSGT
jgi:hypothetical protein